MQLQLNNIKFIVINYFINFYHVLITITSSHVGPVFGNKLRFIENTKKETLS